MFRRFYIEYKIEKIEKHMYRNVLALCGCPCVCIDGSSSGSS